VGLAWTRQNAGRARGEDQSDLKTALQDPVVRNTLEQIGATPDGSTPVEFDAFMHAEVTKWEPAESRQHPRAMRPARSAPIKSAQH
jgi:hypothetical protein